MSYKDINEKYKKILQEDIEKRNEEKEKELNEAIDTNKKKALNDYKKLQKIVNNLIDQLKISLKKHHGEFVIGHGPNMTYIDDLEEARERLTGLISRINIPKY